MDWYQNKSPESEERETAPASSSYWPHASSLSTGFFEITEEDAIAYWFSRLSVQGELESPNTDLKSEELDDEDSSDSWADQVYYPTDKKLRNICHDLHQEFKLPPFRKVRHVQPRNWPGYTLFERNGLPTTLMLPQAFSFATGLNVQEIGLPAPTRSTKPSDLTLMDLARIKKQSRDFHNFAGKRRSESSSPDPDPSPTKKSRSSSDVDNDSSGDSDYGFQECSRPAEQAGTELLELADVSLYCYETFNDSP